MKENEITELTDGDLGESFASRAYAVGSVACDTETSGLDWRTEKLAICQLALPTGEAAIVRLIGARRPEALVRLMADPSVTKVFHHAMFDLRFMAAAWSFEPAAVVCTKIASKLLFPERTSHSLQPLLGELLGVAIDKSQQKSDWLSPQLTKEQVQYALGDVRHLHALYEKLCCNLRERNLMNLASRCYEHIPARVSLELRGYGDVYSY
jgi:ribonuclease D